MDDLRERLERLSARADDEANAIGRLHAARSRGLRRRRVSATALAIVVAIAGTTLAFNSLHGGDAQIAAGNPSPSGPLANWQPPEAPYLWPENWSRDSSQTPADVQAEVDAGKADVQWRTNPWEVARRFGTGVFGWEYTEAQQVGDQNGTNVYGIHQTCAPDERCPVLVLAHQFVLLTQPAKKGGGGIWNVGAAWTDDLDVTANPLDDPIDAFMPGSTLPLKLNVPNDQTVVVGAVGQNGCADFASVDQDVSASYELLLPSALQPGDDGYDCGSMAASYAFAYTVPKLIVPTGDPFLEPAAITAITAVPYLQDWVLGDAENPATESETHPPMSSASPATAPVRPS
jgi:hypothetical protein